MKQTRRITISDKIFTSEDVRRIAKIFSKQKMLAAKSDHSVLIKYEVIFSDGTTFESESPEVFDDESLTAPARPVALRMSFQNYSLKRQLSIALDHGGSSGYFTNTAVVSADDSTWLSENFLALKEAIDTAAPQRLWLRRHKTVFLNLLALGIGTLVNLISGLITGLAFHIYLPHTPELKIPAAWQPFLPLLHVMLYVMLWLTRWAMGHLLGAYQVRQWFLSMWPTIEFDFGSDHLKTERVRRARLIGVGVLIVLPVVASLVAEFIYGRL